MHIIVKSKAERSEAERSVSHIAATIQGTSLRYVGRRSIKVKAKRILLLYITYAIALLGYSRFGHTIIRLNKIMRNNFLLKEIYAIRFSAKRDFDQTLLCKTRLGK